MTTINLRIAILDKHQSYLPVIMIYYLHYMLIRALVNYNLNVIVKSVAFEKESIHVNCDFSYECKWMKTIEDHRIVNNVGCRVCWSTNKVMAQGEYTH